MQRPWGKYQFGVFKKNREERPTGRSAVSGHTRLECGKCVAWELVRQEGPDDRGPCQS